MQDSTPLKVSKYRARPRPVKAAQPSTASSPLAPAMTGLTPDQLLRRASFNFISGDQSAGPSWSPASNMRDESEVDTPSKKSGPRNRSTSAMSLKSAKSPQPERSDSLEHTLGDLDDITQARPPFHISHTLPNLLSETGRQDPRPTIRDRSVSEPPSTQAKKFNGPQIDRKLEFMIKAGPKTKSSGSLYVYVTKTHECSRHLLKIGVTKYLPEKRGKDIQYQCKHQEFFEHDEATTTEFSWNTFAEKLVHAELANFRRVWTCSCGTKHREYFDVSDEIALEVWSRWRDFCIQEPWDSQGRLLPMWEHRLRHRVRFNDAKRDFDHGELARHWRTCVLPSSLELCVNDTRVLWNHIYPSRWLLAAVAEALTMVFIWPTSFWTSMWWKVVLILAVLELFSLDGMYMKESVSRLLSGSLQRLKLWQSSGSSDHRLNPDAKELLPVVSSEQHAQNELREDPDAEMMEDVPNPEDDDMVNEEGIEFDSDRSSDDEDENMEEDTSPGESPQITSTKSTPSGAKPRRVG
ncbi:hypothetical protein BDP55DRAFT_645705 [Colletotrichum godetiae]|uniref:Bacteriophage T5 Orf172 DNA-binding domain-containing protein n=1 Tax=Colletotrichum godetiae TaxID=1209918 RepID=A0AAJ0F432_9PEZI|nr:uncharacterized protein BDP55DRAFT_645705 [Colletotrichum godetiae]KAK1700035.1 hypothetical protein BDP55DRAFT_645705 [Colletotrichum godetiae]